MLLFLQLYFLLYFYNVKNKVTSTATNTVVKPQTETKKESIKTKEKKDLKQKQTNTRKSWFDEDEQSWSTRNKSYSTEYHDYYSNDDINAQCCHALLGFIHEGTKSYFKSTLKSDS